MGTFLDIVHCSGVFKYVPLLLGLAKQMAVSVSARRPVQVQHVYSNTPTYTVHACNTRICTQGKVRALSVAINVLYEYTQD
jgi:hypothetical protein